MAFNPQTSYALGITGTLYEGNLSDSRDVEVDARRNDLAASAEALYGKAVCKSSNTDDLGFGLCNASSQFQGVLVFGQQHEKSTTGLANGEFGSVMKKGRCWVKVVHNVTPASLVRVFIADYSGTTADAVQGAFGTTLVAANTALLANARYLGRGSAGDLVEVEIDASPVLLTADS